MTKTIIASALLLPLALSGCGEPADQAAMSPDPAASESAAPSPPEPLAPPPPLMPEADKGETGARALLLDWARALELGRLEEAWAMLGEADREKWPLARFTDEFADLNDILVAVPGGSMEGAAGSLTYTSHATITATDDAGRPVRFEGPIVLRRVNDVPGATPDQLRWSIARVGLDWTH